MDNNRPRVSIGIPVYNGDNYIARALDTFLAQTFTDLEIVISDNASTDRTQAICEEYAAKYPQIRYHRSERNVGSRLNFVRVATLATGEYFRWAAHDDLCDSRSIEMCVEVLDRRPDVVLAYPQVVHIDENEQPIPLDAFKMLRVEQPTPSQRFARYLDVTWFQPWNTLMVDPVFGLMRLDVLKKTPIYDSFMGGDRVLLGELALHGAIVEVPGCYFQRRIHKQMSEQAARTDFHLALMLTPEREGKIIIPRWPMFRGLVSAVRRAPLPPRERALCYVQVARWLTFYGGPRMARDWAYALARTVNRRRETARARPAAQPKESGESPRPTHP